ncbi:hypothetical protein OM076_30495 [Solirubrobacter ginsenosidimutans]|uniref:Uncharacterized protein n=1 Tax=Solirubrobacter ginsenosidimutans TaxID=490573 RepID=A0A9X3MZP9_9ACTN|nr:hypothetical protein [Solirubrobacter ginsenosidimutans]MDA0164636.1 hypothetical protein [Solirubrobacter ginsenosidimutans]
MLLRTTLLAIAFAVLGTVSASAQTPVPTPVQPPSLGGLRPCYVAATEAQREFVVVQGQNFTPFAKIDIFLDDILQTLPDPQPQAAYDGTLSGSVPAPFIDEGQRTFTLRATEHDTLANSAIATSKVTRLSVEQSPAAAATSDRVRFRGRGFTDLTLPIYMHYVYAGKSKQTISLGLPTGDCGLFSVKRKQFPFKKSPQVGVWTIQFDQKPNYDPKASPRVPLTVKVRKAPKIKPKRSPAR